MNKITRDPEDYHPQAIGAVLRLSQAEVGRVKEYNRSWWWQQQHHHNQGSGSKRK
jgi:hypothetical protein